MRAVVAILLGLLSGSISSEARVRPIVTEYADDNLLFEELDAEALKAASSALQRFKKRRADLKCYTVDIYRDGFGWRVAFIANQSDPRTISVGATRCGQSISYVVDANFVVVREIFNR